MINKEQIKDVPKNDRGLVLLPLRAQKHNYSKTILDSLEGPMTTFIAKDRDVLWRPANESAAEYILQLEQTANLLPALLHLTIIVLRHAFSTFQQTDMQRALSSLRGGPYNVINKNFRF